MSEQTYLTEEGAEELKRELEELISVRRPALAIKLKEAVAEGDLKENANPPGRHLRNGKVRHAPGPGLSDRHGGDVQIGTSLA